VAGSGAGHQRNLDTLDVAGNRAGRLARRFRKSALADALKALIVCSHWEDVQGYLTCARAEDAGSPLELHVRGVPFPLLCRPGTSDADVLWDTFGRRYHLPPVSLPQDAVILDLGANVGYTAIDFAVRYPQAKIIAVELDDQNVGIAERNLHVVGDRCTLVRAAVWAETKEVSYGGDSTCGFHVLIAGEVAPSYRRTAAVTVDDLLSRFSIDRVDYLKMDIEGAEASVLTPGAPWMRVVDVLKVEVHPPATLEECHGVLSGQGFAVRRDRHHPASLVAVRSCPELPNLP